jgi:hypothetical protein
MQIKLNNEQKNQITMLTEINEELTKKQNNEGQELVMKKIQEQEELILELKNENDFLIKEKNT